MIFQKDLRILWKFSMRRIDLNKYDVIIVGAGASGVFASYEFKKINSGLKVLVIEKGNSIYKRQCPIKTGQVLHWLQTLQYYEWIWWCRYFI